MNPFPPALLDFFWDHPNAILVLWGAIFVGAAIVLLGLCRSAHDADEHLDDYFDSARPDS